MELATYSNAYGNSNYDKDSEPPEYIDIIAGQAPNAVNAPTCLPNKPTSQTCGNNGMSFTYHNYF